MLTDGVYCERGVLYLKIGAAVGNKERKKKTNKEINKCKTKRGDWKGGERIPQPGDYFLHVV